MVNIQIFKNEQYIKIFYEVGILKNTNTILKFYSTVIPKFEKRIY